MVKATDVDVLIENSFIASYTRKRKSPVNLLLFLNFTSSWLCLKMAITF